MKAIKLKPIFFRDKDKGKEPSPPTMALRGLWRRISRKKTISDDASQKTSLKRCLTTFDLTALGIGATMGVGIYVLSGEVAKEVAGPSILLSFVVSGLAAVMSGFCYAEMGAR